MGSYINQLPNGEPLPATGKVPKLLTIPGAHVVPDPLRWEEGLVCVVSNGSFEAAAYAFDESEMQEFLRPDGRPKLWLWVPDAHEIALPKMK